MRIAIVSGTASFPEIAPYPFSNIHGCLHQIYDAFGPDRLLWGTGFPGAARSHYKVPHLKEELDLIRKEISFFTAEDKKKILGLNAARIWKLQV